MPGLLEEQQCTQETTLHRVFWLGNNAGVSSSVYALRALPPTLKRAKYASNCIVGHAPGTHGKHILRSKRLARHPTRQTMLQTCVRGFRLIMHADCLNFCNNQPNLKQRRTCRCKQIPSPYALAARRAFLAAPTRQRVKYAQAPRTSLSVQ